MENRNLSLMEIGIMMHEVFRVFKKRIAEQKDDEIKLSADQFGLLHAITTKEEDVIQKDMAEKMGKDKSAMLRLIDTLEEKGLVRRVNDLKDRRKNYLMVTKVGYRVKEQYMKIVYEIINEVQQGLTPSEIDTFHKVINHIKSNAVKL
jgi:MarR family transcriptional regulator for hemolysin